MIKSNRDMREIVPFKRRKPLHAEGRFCLDLTDPVTGKVKERVDGKNMVFPEMLFMDIYATTTPSTYYAYADSAWNDPGIGVNALILALNDDGTAANADFPFLRGQTIGYGKPGAGSLNTYRGAYSAANQVLGEISLTKQRWKFQYDFTTAQANGTIRNAGLTRQYLNSSQAAGSNGVSRHNLFGTTVMKEPGTGYTCDGRYAAQITYNSTTGIVTVYDMWFGAKTEIDLSAMVGTSSSEYKFVGYNPLTGKWYIYKYSGTAANRRVWVFTDQTFSNIETTYTPTNVAISPGLNSPFYVYGDVMYLLTPTGSTWCYTADFVANTAAVGKTFSYSGIARNNALYNEGLTSNSLYAGYCTLGRADGIFIMNGNTIAYGIGIGYIYDPSVDDFVAAFSTNAPESNNQKAAFYHPLLDTKIIHTVGNTSRRIYGQLGAVTTYVLPEPVTKTSANGMTVTYELEVFWE